MQSDLVIKENELIDPSDYPEDQRSLVNDFNSRIRRLTGIITGILNRGSGERKVIDAMANGKNGMLCILDVDKFKNTNDDYGHNVGDKVLRGIADVLKLTFRDDDIIFRLGGSQPTLSASRTSRYTCPPIPSRRSPLPSHGR